MNQPIIIDGKKSSLELRTKIKQKIDRLKTKYNITPGLAFIVVGSNPASELYVNIKSKRAKEIGINSYIYQIPETASTRTLISKIEKLNQDHKIHGILVQMPLPLNIDSIAIINSINPMKDVDGFHPINIGKLWTNQLSLIPCTPQGCMMLLKEYIGEIKGLNALVIGRSTIVGKPMSAILLKENCTVTMAHSYTRNLKQLCQNSDIIVAAAGNPLLVKEDWVNSNSIVIDVGINRTSDNNIIGDVDFNNVKNKVRAITPVPGGVGPMTVACLLKNTFLATCYQKQIGII